jgi:hypothetical protein
MQKNSQSRERCQIDMRSARNSGFIRAVRPLEHPGRDFQPAIRIQAAQRATENSTIRLVDCVMHANPKAKPRMPPIQELAKRCPVGVLKPHSTTQTGRTRPWLIKHPRPSLQSSPQQGYTLRSLMAPRSALLLNPRERAYKCQRL